MADTPTIFGVPMRHRNIRGWGPCWYLNGVTIEQYPPSTTYHWFVTPRRGAMPVTGSCKVFKTATCQIERAITRIRNAAAKLGT